MLLNACHFAMQSWAYIWGSATGLVYFCAHTMFSVNCDLWLWGNTSSVCSDLLLLFCCYCCVCTWRGLCNVTQWSDNTLIARFMGPTWGPSGADRAQIGPMLAPWTLLPGILYGLIREQAAWSWICRFQQQKKPTPPWFAWKNFHNSFVKWCHYSIIYGREFILDLHNCLIETHELATYQNSRERESFK